MHLALPDLAGDLVERGDYVLFKAQSWSGRTGHLERGTVIDIQELPYATYLRVWGSNDYFFQLLPADVKKVTTLQ